MSLKLTAQSFVAGFKQSGLLPPAQIDSLLLELQRAGLDCSDSRNIAQALIQRQVLTEWQAEKLLQGRHKGFLLGRYKLLNLLGAGEMSAVYLAEHTLLERRCAIKVLPGNKVRDTSYLGRFHREARAVAALDHPNIVRAYDVDQQTDGGAEIHFLVMEYVAGRSLEKLVADQGPLSLVEAADYIRQAATGLQHAHLAGLVHRDIKPGNLLCDLRGTVKILDLGLARFFKAEEEESLTIKHDEKVLGTADYLAPEQAIDSHKVDSRADIYSLGCTFYFALTGHPPFTDGTLVQRLLAHQTRTPKPIQKIRPDVPTALVAILDKMMAKQAAARYQTAEELALALTHWLMEAAPQTWQEKNLSLVAQTRGFQAYTAPVAVPVTPPVPAPVEIPAVTTQVAATPVEVVKPEPVADLEIRIQTEPRPARPASGSPTPRKANSSGKRSTTTTRANPKPTSTALTTERRPAASFRPQPQAAATGHGIKPFPLWSPEVVATIPVWQVATVASGVLVVGLTIVLLGFSFWGGSSAKSNAQNEAGAGGTTVSMVTAPLE